MPAVPAVGTARPARSAVQGRRHLAAYLGGELPPDRQLAARGRGAGADTGALLHTPGPPPSTWYSIGDASTVPSSCSPPPGVGRWCSGSLRVPSSSPGPGYAAPPP